MTSPTREPPGKAAGARPGQSPGADAALPCSVVVVSQGRPAALRRCLLSLRQQSHPSFEVIVVADAGGCDIARDFPARIIPFTERNISAARNAGLLAAASEIVAYIDDDAAAEPGWLMALTQPFHDPGLAGTGGFVLGRSGLDWQWRGRQLDATGRSYPLETPDAEVCEPPTAPGCCIRVEGTNMAFRRSVLLDHGGFDPAFPFYHDESELCWRLHLSGHRIALVPGAVVHHGILPSSRRRQDRMPVSLNDVGRSSALFLNRHSPAQRNPVLQELHSEQRRRLVSHMVAGRCMPGDVGRLLRTLTDGIAEATLAPPWPHPLTAPADSDFHPFTRSPPPGTLVLAGRRRHRKRLEEQAAGPAAAGTVVTIIVLEPGLRRHQLSFGDDGIWRQTGGLFGRAKRGDRLTLQGFRQRVSAEIRRAAATGRFPGCSGKDQVPCRYA